MCSWNNLSSRNKICFLIIIVANLFFLVSCGNSSEGGGDISFELSTSTANFTSNKDDINPPGSVSIVVTANNGTVYFGFDYNNYNLSFDCNGTRRCILTISPPYMGSTPSGTYNDTIIVYGYKVDGVKTNPFMSKVINVSYTVTDGLSVSPNNLSFASVESETPSPQILTATYASPLAWTLTSAVNASDSWIIPSALSGTTDSEIAVSVESMRAGSYTGNVNFSHALTKDHKSIGVNYDVQPMLYVDPFNLPAFNITGSSLLSDLSQNLVIGLNPNAVTSPDISWYASTQSSWMRISSSTGDTTNNKTIAVNLIVSELNKLNNGDYDGVITITPDSDLYSPIDVTIHLSLRVPQITYVSPNVVYAGGTLPVIIRGNDFGNAILDINIGSNIVTATRKDSTTIRITELTLPVGNYPLYKDIPTGINNSKAILTVTNSVVFPYKFFAISGSQGRISYDAKTNSILIVNRSEQTLHRATYNGTDWDIDSAYIQYLYDIDLTPDSEEIIATNTQSIMHIDAVTLALKKTITPLFIDQYGYSNNNRPKSIRIGNSGDALIGMDNNNGQLAIELARYRLSDNSFSDRGYSYSAVSWFDSRPARDLISASDVSSTYGAKLFNGDIVGVESVYRWGAQPTYMHFSAVGDRAVYKNSVWAIGENSDPNISPFPYYSSYIGYISENAEITPGTILYSVMSPDGLTAYAYHTDRKIRSYDVSTIQHWQYSEKGIPISIPDDLGNNIKMEITPNGRNLIIGGSLGLVITPVP